MSVFPKQLPSTDQATRDRQLRGAGPKAKETLERLTDEYYELHEKHPGEDSYALMVHFLGGRG
jgi:hypothetical protein